MRHPCTPAILSLLLFLSWGALFLGCTLSGETDLSTGSSPQLVEPGLLATLKEAGSAQHSGAAITVTYPYAGAVFPPEIASPTITWQDTSGKSDRWFITVDFANGSKPLHAVSPANRWQIEKALWHTIKRSGAEAPITFAIRGFEQAAPERILSYGEVEISIAPVGVEAAILFRQVPLPFPVDNIGRMKWRLGDISSYRPPKVILQGLNVCASCHTASSDGKFLSMEMNYGNDPGAQFIAPVQKTMTISREAFFSWNDVPRPGILPKSRGLFGRMSPQADYALATVNELSLALLTNDSSFSQVFFPTYGILAWYSVAQKSFAPLPGADDYDYVHANPEWSPDGSRIVFARAKTKNQVHDNIMDVSPQFKDEDIHSLNKRYNIQFDLYTLPFNNGNGGTAVPLDGASFNSMSNYFPRYSPDGKWIVFTRSRTGIMLQPDSQLFIVPAAGGTARRMRCNRDLFNSWHSWSPNSRWLLFSSKVNTPFTEIFLTYIDENGLDHPPVLLDRFSDSEFAANVPEFVNFSADAVDRIVVR